MVTIRYIFIADADTDGNGSSHTHRINGRIITCQTFSRWVTYWHGNYGNEDTAPADGDSSTMMVAVALLTGQWHY